MGIDADGRVTSFLEKPRRARRRCPASPELALASMGIYVFNTDVMYELLFQDAARKEASRHDFGKDIIPGMLADGTRVLAYPFRDENRKDGRLLARRRHARRLLPDEHGPDRRSTRSSTSTTATGRSTPTSRPSPPPKFVHTDGDRRGSAFNSIVCQGVIVSGGQVYRVILSPGVRIHSYALVEDSILFDGVDIGRHARVRRAIIDKGVRVPPGFDHRLGPPARPRPRPHRHPRGVTVVPKDEDLERFVV